MATRPSSSPPVLPPLQIPVLPPTDAPNTPLSTPASPALSDDSDCLFRLDVDNVRSLLPQDITTLPPVLRVTNEGVCNSSQCDLIGWEGWSLTLHYLTSELIFSLLFLCILYGTDFNYLFNNLELLQLLIISFILMIRMSYSMVILMMKEKLDVGCSQIILMYDYSTLLPDEGSQYVLDETWQAAQKVSTLRDEIMIIAAQ